MKTIILIILSILSVNLYASNCYKRLCLNDTVRDQFGWKGTIVSFDEINDEVEVGLSHTPSTYNFPYNDLGKKVVCYKGLCQSQTAKDNRGTIVDIIEVYNHGLVYVFDESIDGNLLYDIKELSY